MTSHSHHMIGIYLFLHFYLEFGTEVKFGADWFRKTAFSGAMSFHTITVINLWDTKEKTTHLQSPYKREGIIHFPEPPFPQSNVEIMWRGRLVPNQHCSGGGEGEMKTKVTFQQDTKVSQDL